MVVHMGRWDRKDTTELLRGATKGGMMGWERIAGVGSNIYGQDLPLVRQDRRTGMVMADLDMCALYRR